MRKYTKLVGVQDQTHVANLCMQDIWNIPRVKEVLNTVTWIASETMQKLKLRARVMEAIVEYNRTISPQSRGTRIGPCQEEIAGGLTRGVEGRVMFLPTIATAVTLCRPVKRRFASIESTLQAYIRTRWCYLG